MREIVRLMGVIVDLYCASYESTRQVDQPAIQRRCRHSGRSAGRTPPTPAFHPLLSGALACGVFGFRIFSRSTVKKYVPFFDFLQGPRRLTREARRFIFSIQHTHIRLANPTEYGDVGFVIFQFTAPINRVRNAIAHFDAGISFWSDKEIGVMDRRRLSRFG